MIQLDGDSLGEPRVAMDFDSQSQQSAPTSCILWNHIISPEPDCSPSKKKLTKPGQLSDDCWQPNRARLTVRSPHTPPPLLRLARSSSLPLSPVVMITTPPEEHALHAFPEDHAERKGASTTGKERRRSAGNVHPLDFTGKFSDFDLSASVETSPDDKDSAYRSGSSHLSACSESKSPLSTIMAAMVKNEREAVTMTTPDTESLHHTGSHGNHETAPTTSSGKEWDDDLDLDDSVIILASQRWENTIIGGQAGLEARGSVPWKPLADKHCSQTRPVVNGRASVTTRPIVNGRASVTTRPRNPISSTPNINPPKNPRSAVNRGKSINRGKASRGKASRGDPSRGDPSPPQFPATERQKLFPVTEDILTNAVTMGNVSTYQGTPTKGTKRRADGSNHPVTSRFTGSNHSVTSRSLAGVFSPIAPINDSDNTHSPTVKKPRFRNQLNAQSRGRMDGHGARMDGHGARMDGRIHSGKSGTFVPLSDLSFNKPLLSKVTTVNKPLLSKVTTVNKPLLSKVTTDKQFLAASGTVATGRLETDNVLPADSLGICSKDVSIPEDILDEMFDSFGDESSTEKQSKCLPINTPETRERPRVVSELELRLDTDVHKSSNSTAQINSSPKPRAGLGCLSVDGLKPCARANCPPVDKPSAHRFKFTRPKSGHPPPKNGDSPLKNGDPPLKHGDSPLKNGDPPLKSGDPPLKSGDPPLKHGDSPLRSGDSLLKSGNLPLKHPDLPLKSGDLPLKCGEPPLKSGEPPFKSGDPPLKSGEPPLKNNEPPLKSGKPPLKSGKPPLKSGEPPLKSGEPPLKSGDLPLKSDNPPLKSGEHPLKSGSTPFKSGDIRTAQKRSTISINQSDSVTLNGRRPSPRAVGGATRSQHRLQSHSRPRTGAQPTTNRHTIVEAGNHIRPARAGPTMKSLSNECAPTMKSLPGECAAATKSLSDGCVNLWDPVNRSSDTPTAFTPVAVCSQEEIEKKRQAALARKKTRPSAK